MISAGASSGCQGTLNSIWARGSASRRRSGCGRLLHAARRAPRRGVARYRRHRLTRQQAAQFFIGVPRRERAERVAVLPLAEIASQQALDRVGHLGRRRTIADGPRRVLVLAHTAADAEIVGVDHRALELRLLPLDTKVGDPVLAAAIGTAGDVDLQVLVEARHARLELLHQPARETLGLGEGELAELGARARDGPAPER